MLSASGSIASRLHAKHGHEAIPSVSQGHAIHYSTLHYTTLYHIALHYTTLHYIIMQLVLCPGAQLRAKRQHLPRKSACCRSDTFFIASVHMDPAAGSGRMAGCQLNHINHKGGYPGFVQADRSGRLCWGDYAGNNALSTLGELQKCDCQPAPQDKCTHCLGSAR